MLTHKINWDKLAFRIICAVHNAAIFVCVQYNLFIKPNPSG